MISIIIPTLDEEDYLPRLLASIDKQDYKDKEVIVVDASSDGTKHEAFRHKVTVLQSKANVSYQKNLGARKAKGDVLLFVDADMELEEGFLHKLEKDINGKDCVSCRIHINPKEANITDRLIHGYTNLFIGMLVWYGATRGGCHTVRKDKFLGFGQDLTVGEDVDLFRRQAKKGKMGFSKATAYESPRRFRKLGYIRVLIEWFLSYFFKHKRRRVIVR